MEQHIEDEARRLARVTCGYNTLSIAEEANWRFIADSLLEAERQGAQRALREAAADMAVFSTGGLQTRPLSGKDIAQRVSAWLEGRAEALSPHGQDAQEPQR